MIRKYLIRLLSQKRDLEGKFTTRANRRLVRRIAKQMRAEMPGKKWKRAL